MENTESNFFVSRASLNHSHKKGLVATDNFIIIEKDKLVIDVPRTTQCEPVLEIESDSNTIGWTDKRKKLYENYFLDGRIVATFHFNAKTGFRTSETYHEKDTGQIYHMVFYDKNGVFKNQSTIDSKDPKIYKQKIYAGSGEKLLYDGFLDNSTGHYHGSGTLYNIEGYRIYDGDFQNGEMAGIGILYDKDGTKEYQGQLTKGEKNGEGVYWYRNAQKQYQGTFKNNQWDGYGVLFLDNGVKIYEGGWLQGEKHGKGIEYDDEERIIYEGGFNTGNRQGKGALYSESGL